MFGIKPDVERDGSACVKPCIAVNEVFLQPDIFQLIKDDICDKLDFGLRKPRSYTVVDA